MLLVVGVSQAFGLALILASVFVPWVSMSAHFGQGPSYASADFYAYTEGRADVRIAAGFGFTVAQVPALIGDVPMLYVLPACMAIIGIASALSLSGKRLGVTVGALGALLALLSVVQTYLAFLPRLRSSDFSFGFPGVNMAMVAAILVIIISGWGVMAQKKTDAASA